MCSGDRGSGWYSVDENVWLDQQNVLVIVIHLNTFFDRSLRGTETSGTNGITSTDEWQTDK